MDSNTYYNIGPNKFQKSTLCTEKFAQTLQKKRSNWKKNAITQQPIKITQLRLKRRQWEHCVSWHGKTELRFIEGHAGGQEDIPVYRRKKKTVNQKVYTEEMCPMMFSDITAAMNGDSWTWQQDGARAHTARSTVEWLRLNTPDFITPQQWPAKSPDLNVLDYSLWGILLAGVADNRPHIEDINQLKATLIDCWNAIPMRTVQKACSSWIPRLRSCIEMQGGHFEHTL